MNSRRNYAKAAREEPMKSWQVHGHRSKSPQISFTEEDEAGIHYLHCDACTLDQMDVDHELTAISEPLCGFTGDSLISQGRITLAVDFDEPPCHLKKFMEFLIVDTRSAYHGVFRRPALKDLQAVMSIHHPVMKFPTPGGVVKVCRNQTEVRACYMNALRKVVKREDVAPAVMTIHSEPMDVDYKELDEEMVLDEGLDPQIIGSDSLASLAEELEAFPVNSLRANPGVEGGREARGKDEERIEAVLVREH
ncbi:Uncharacterized protein Adt_33678 [Abeliophyllum distichum]|uniref:Uncharacterized protein n=1 Tax=Abeliophyllum distichum TaxID=126358 RepID=A0ABD1QY78_9LAMI